MAAKRLCRDYLSPLFACCSRYVWLPFNSSEDLHSHCFFSKHTFSTATEQTGTCKTVQHDCRNGWRKTEIAGIICAHLGKGCISAWCPHDKARGCNSMASVPATCNRSCRCVEKACLWHMTWGMGMMTAIGGFFMKVSCFICLKTSHEQKLQLYR